MWQIERETMKCVFFMPTTLKCDSVMMMMEKVRRIARIFHRWCVVRSFFFVRLVSHLKNKFDSVHLGLCH